VSQAVSEWQSERVYGTVIRPDLQVIIGVRVVCGWVGAVCVSEWMSE